MNGVKQIKQGVSEGDFRIFIGMDEDSIKAAFKEWLHRLCEKNGWLNKDGKIIIARIAAHFQVSRQTVTNWLLGVSCLSTQKVNQVIAPRMGISTARFWHEMQLIDRELKGFAVTPESNGFKGEKAMTAEDVMLYIMAMPPGEKERIKKIYLTSVAEGKV